MGFELKQKLLHFPHFLLMPPPFSPRANKGKGRKKKKQKTEGEFSVDLHTVFYSSTTKISDYIYIYIYNKNYKRKREINAV